MVIDQIMSTPVFKITVPVFEDFRGIYLELYNKAMFQKIHAPIEFLQDDISISYKDVLRGIHGDQTTWKLISCLMGALYVVIVNNDPANKDYKKWISLTISEQKREQILVPPKHGIGHLVRSERAIFWYKQSTYYSPETQFTIKWNDPAYKIWWPIKNPITSQRDEGITHVSVG
jgi:dTDP-4-dehydrorhamnose 3,5-epimerase